MVIICGIAGISMSPQDMKSSAREAAVGLLRGIASRGPDATGAAWYKADKDVIALTKQPVPAWRFIEAREERIPEATPTMILHTRMSTHGSTSDRRNNHPIVHGNIVGIHNGVLSNDDRLFAELKVERHGEVDSEAIFALLNQEDAVPTEVLGRIRGDAAIAWIDIRQPEVLHLAKVTGRPLYVAQLTTGTLLFASTKSAVDNAVREMKGVIEFAEEMKDEHYMRVEGGVIKDYQKIENVVSLGSTFSQRYAYTSGPSSASVRGTTAPAQKPMWEESDASFRGVSSAAKEVGQAVKAIAGNVPAGREASKGAGASKGTLSRSGYEWLQSRSTEELIKMVSNGSKWAKEELEARADGELAQRDRDRRKEGVWDEQKQELVFSDAPTV